MCTQVLSLGDPWIPADMEAPRRGAVPVRFFGTYNFAWIESQRSLNPCSDPLADERASKSQLKVRATPLLAASERQTARNGGCLIASRPVARLISNANNAHGEHHAFADHQRACL